MSEEGLVVFPKSLVKQFYIRPQLVREDSRTDRLLAALGGGKVVPRTVAESAPSVTQAVAYATLRSGNKLVCLKRTSKDRRELDNRWTLVFGGHVNSEERDGLPGLRRCVQRELREEFGSLVCSQIRFIGVVADPRSEVGRRHLGFMFEVRVIEDTVGLDRRFDNHEYSLIPGRRHFSKIDQLLTVDNERFDPWSQLVLGAYRDLAEL